MTCVTTLKKQEIIELIQNGENSGVEFKLADIRIKEDPRITYDQLAQRTGLNRKTIQRHLRSLKEQGVVYRIGPAKGGHWELKE